MNKRTIVLGLACGFGVIGSLYGNDFSEFYVDFKTGKLGLKSFLGKGFYQGQITETWLLSHGYEKKTG